MEGGGAVAREVAILFDGSGAGISGTEERTVIG
jgi:hypothetical protein